MKILHDNKFISITFDIDKQLLIDTWKPECEKMSSEQMRNEIENIAELIKKHSPKYILADNKKRSYLYKVNEQNWVADTLVSAGISVGVLKYALTTPEDFVAEISTNQIADEVVEIPIEVKFFENQQEAMDWLGI